MKIALCLSGHVRNIETTYESLKQHLLSLYDVDIFIDSWDTLGWRVEGQVNKEFKGFDYFTPKINQEKIINLLKPKKYRFNNFSDYENIFFQKSEKYKNRLRVPDRDRPENSVSLYYKIKGCNDLKKEYEKENNFIYDVVIRSRFDMQYYDSVIDKIIIANKDQYVFLPYEESYGYASDILAVSNSKNMDKYSDVYDNLDMMYESGCLMNGHNITKFWMDHNFKNNWTNYNFKIKLNRCRKSCKDRIMCGECHPENRTFSKKEENI